MNTKTKPFRTLLAMHLLALSAFAGHSALANTPYANASLEGALTPGVYGRIEIGTAPPPPLIYAQPIIIQRTPVMVQQPLYLHVPPGHAKKWAKHCARYNACAQPVYFVRVRGDDDYERDQYKKKHRGKGHKKGHDHDDHDD